MTRAVAALGFVLAATALSRPLGASAQLISPGRLSDAHAAIDGIRNCTKCHELGTRGVSAARCLDCHGPLKTRIDAGNGYHGSLTGRDCAECHKEHLGRDFDIVRLDTTSFRHADVGYELRGAHDRVACGECHTPERVHAPDVRAFDGGPGFLGRTLLGLSSTCESCHAPDDPHGRQFRGRACADCHVEDAWTEPDRFDHDRAAYQLTGAHRRVSCSGCHQNEGTVAAPAVRYIGLQFDTCLSCHTDPHAGAMSSTCTRCHSTSGWDQVAAERVERTFDHSRTRFQLAGAHASLSCAACHGRPAPRTSSIRIQFVGGTERSTYPRPVAASCGSCHVDYHAGELRQASAAARCSDCHSEAAWTPAKYDIARHNRESAFQLTGAHVATPCADCHRSREGGNAVAHFRLTAAVDCVACHAANDPHGQAFAGRSCAECHDTESFQVASFDHASAGNIVCRDCHESDDPHGSQFADAACSNCHETGTFRIPQFDHTTTRFPLEGAHAQLSCTKCHVAAPDEQGRPIVVYRSLGRNCIDCHRGGP